MGVKLGPGFPHEGIPSPEDIASEANPNPRVEAEWIQSEGSLAELVLWFNALAQEGVARTATSVRELPMKRLPPTKAPPEAPPKAPPKPVLCYLPIRR